MLNKKILVVIFSFNRALQLDCLLRTFYKHIKTNDYLVKVIFHSTGNHSAGYMKLKEKYKSSSIEFLERQQIYSFWNDSFPLFFRNRNLWRYIKHPYLRSKLDNFKNLLEQTILLSKCDFTMFLTDDGYYFKDIDIPEIILDKINNNPLQTSYRMYVGRNLQDCPKNLKIEDGYFKWNYYDPMMYNHWSYPFAVDNTIYNSEALIKIIKPIFYHMPTTLESYVVTYCQTRNMLGIGYGPIESNYVGLFINRVSTIGTNFSGIVNIDMLNEKFLEGYELDFDFAVPPNQQALIPEKIILYHAKNEQIIIHP